MYGRMPEQSKKLAIDHFGIHNQALHWDLITLNRRLHRVSKNVPPSTCYNLDMHDPITIIFGRNVTEKVINHMMLCFSTALIYRFCITLQNMKPRGQRTGALCIQHSPTAAALSTSLLLNRAPNSPVYLNALITRLRSHTAA